MSESAFSPAPATPPGAIFILNTLHSGGAEKQLLWIGHALLAQGPVTIIELRETRGKSRMDRLIEEAQAAGVRFVRARGKNYLRSWLAVGREMSAAPQAVVWSWGMRADASVYTWRRLGRRGAPWICSLRNAYRHGVESSAWLYRRFVSEVTLFVANTHANCDMLVEVCPPAREKCRVLPNVLRELAASLLLPLPTARPKTVHIAMLGNIDISRKGYDTAVELGKLILAERLPVEIHIAGRGDNQDWLLGEVRRHRLNNVMHYHGEVREPLEFLKRHQAYLLLSRFEGMPNALLEALCLGLPAVVTDVGDLKHLLREPRPYLLIPHGSAPAALAAIKELLADWTGAIAMGRRGRDWCEQNFSEASCRRQLGTIWNEVAGNRPSA